MRYHVDALQQVPNLPVSAVSASVVVTTMLKAA
jgi:hypothetical protein